MVPPVQRRATAVGTGTRAAQQPDWLCSKNSRRRWRRRWTPSFMRSGAAAAAYHDHLFWPLFNSRWASPPTSGNDRGRRPCYAARCKSKSRLPQEIQVQSRSGTTEIINAVGPLQFFESGYAHYNSNHVLLLWLTGNCPQKRIPTRLGYAHFGVAPLWTRISVLNAEGGELLAHSASMKTVGWRQRRRWRTGSRASKKTKREGRFERRY